MADKYKVREYVKTKGLEHILPVLYGVWNNAEKIDFEKLPDKFVLKCTHSCGMNIICNDKTKLDQNKTVETLNKWICTKHPVYYETHYNKIKPLIICEEYIFDGINVLPTDYKIHCAHGTPIYIQVCLERTASSPGKRIIYDKDWNDLHFVKEDDYHHSVQQGVPKPKHLKEMLEYASVLSSDLNYARIDFYDTNEKVYFGEITLTPMGGWLSYFTKEALDFMGAEIRNKRNKNQNEKRKQTNSYQQYILIYKINYCRYTWVNCNPSHFKKSRG